MKMKLTKGEYRVGVHSQDDLVVFLIKRKSAELIDLIGTIKAAQAQGNNATVSEELQNEVERLKTLAQDGIESASMWAVKAATKPERKNT